jgi:hypothetical protein
METTECRPVLFPYLTLSEGDFRHLALLIPRTYLLQVLDPPPLPTWGRTHFSALSVDLDEQEKDQIGRDLRSYQEYAANHQDHCLAASFSSETLSRRSRESRFDIQNSLRSKGNEGPDPETQKLLEAAVFLEMATELDQKESDLESDLAEASRLESEFREILGIDAEDAHDDAIETLTPPLTATRAHLSFMLLQRITSWLRLFSSRLSAGITLPLVTVNREVVDELVERVEAFTRDRSPKPTLLQVPLISIPSLPKLPSDVFASKLGELRQTENPQRLGEALEALLSDPQDAGRQESTQSAGKSLKEAIRSVFGLSAAEYPAMQLSLTSFGDLTLADLWRALMPGNSVPSGWDSLPAPCLFCLQEQHNAGSLFPGDD